MNYFWLDASAIVKRYLNEEKGTSEMHYFFNHVPQERMMICVSATVGEVISIFTRRRNINKSDPKNKDGITENSFKKLTQMFESEVSQHPQVTKVYPTNSQIDDSVKFIMKYPIGNYDAIILQCALNKANELRIIGNNLIMVSSDQKLLRTSRNEGLSTFNPETNKIKYLNDLINA